MPHLLLLHSLGLQVVVESPRMFHAWQEQVGHTKVGHTNVGHTKVGHTKVGHTKAGHTKVGHTKVGHTKVVHPACHQHGSSSAILL
jgi:hypothetical protein